MDTLISIAPGAREARRPPADEVDRPHLASGWGPNRAGDQARELDAEVTRLLRVRGGELAEPLLWQRAGHRREVDEILRQLAPIRSRIALLSSWSRESRLDSPLRLAYAITWLRLAQRRAGEYGPRRRPGPPGAGRHAAVTARG
jgi:hypothetical protein